MAEDVLALIQEAGDKASMAGDDARQIAVVLQQLQQNMAAMASEIDGTVAEGAALLARLGERAAAVEAEVKSQLSLVNDALEKADAQATSTQHVLDARFDELQKRIATVTQQVDTVTSTLAKDSKELNDVLADLDLKEKAFDAQVQSAVERARQSVKTFRDTLDAEKASLEGRFTDLAAQYDALESEVGRRVAALVAEIESGLAKGRDALADFEAATAAAAAKADATVSASVGEERVAALEKLFQALEAAVTALGGLADDPLAMADGDLVEISKKLQAAVKPLHGISDVHRYGRSLEVV